MRLHRVEVQAFGLFAGRERVDVDALADSGLFLLHGPTGAGKTSVLDAVCFALYGRVPGTRSSGSRLRSDHAAEGLAPEVLVDVSVGGRRFEVTRSPAWERPKRRGKGVTTEPARLLLRERVNGAWSPVSSRNDEGSQLLTDVLGMGLEQFTRVVLLPQGEFAAFLRAPAEERRPLLQRLFGTDRFADVEAWLAEQRRGLAAERERADASLDRLLARVEQAAAALPADDAGLREPDERPRAEPEPPPVELMAAEASLSVSLAAATNRCERLQRRAVAVLHCRRREQQEARARHERASVRHDELEAERRRAQRLEAALAERDALTEQAPEIVQMEGTLERAHAARSLAGELRVVESARRERDRTQTRVREASAAVEACGLAVDARTTADRLLGLEATARQDVGRLADLLHLETETTRTARRSDRLTRDLVGLREQTGRLDELLDGLAARVDAETDGADVLVPRAADLPLAQHAVSEAGSRLTAARASARLRIVLRGEQQALEAATDEAQSARQTWLDLREQRLAGIAAELAAGLRGGQACPVCGSAEHPSPAPSSGGAVSEQDERDAGARAEVAVARRADVERRLSGTASELAVHDERSGGAAVDVAEHLHHQALRRLHDAEEAADQLEKQRRLLDALASERQERAAERASLLQRLAGSAAELAEVERSLSEARARLDTARGTDRSIADRRDRLDRQAKALQDLRRCREAAQAGERALVGAEEAAEAAARLAGFDDAGDAGSALLDDDELRRLREQVDAHRAALARIDGRLADEEMRTAVRERDARLRGGVAHDPLVGLAREARLERADAEAADEQARAALVVAESTAAALGLLREQVEAEVAATEPLRTRHALVGDLARCAEGTGGGNTFRMRLSSYVLAARLEQVAAAATVRLDEMSAGRYALVHSDVVERGGRRSGLGLQVVDAWTGQQRETSTLSGGESFLASLALALGLADVVQAEAGGTAIETLFVDEGFGSLDAETLDDVMAVLDSLRDGGRCVGLVSHVGELQQRVSARLEVVKTRAGSHLRVGCHVA